ncbi:tRNA glutamyl-Q(34) synthetase GluQRS [Alteromonas sp. ASW11-36]|uniref:tRNA glutamyl-Q(34) synthetase GluQRS n=1 Tax=Alteromonas arenosi TaxID=3055817 RepID=A0ABT7SZ50_9ALTE|nr:tRNA glutamyl-Q(34) synthetase GluQRS [Alteromonas sp. ASW11-36]MDM7861289.1 tRNA glutamyl-Q(34) synthetase GluQRS [Alteromonas sp. ASW11-36]
MTATNMHSPSGYIGRFAPSPTGPLHLGSLATALASYLHAKQSKGKWLLRMEDIDTPRCVAGADQLILQTLLAHGLRWDGDVLYQSESLQRYSDVLSSLAQYTYRCDCTRAQIKARGMAYDGHCRKRNKVDSPYAIRFRHQVPVQIFEDLLLGNVQIDDPFCTEDFVLKRRDGLFAYHLVVVADDIYQGVNTIVRGADLLATTSCHLALYHALHAPTPTYAHLPVLATAPGMKLSKQNHAPAVDDKVAVSNLHKALAGLGFVLPQQQDLSSVSAIIEWAEENADVSTLSGVREVIVESA